MVQRWVQQKQLKIKKYNRALSMVKPRQGGVDQAKIQEHTIFQNRNRVNTIQGRADQSLPVLNNTWMEPIPETNKTTFIGWDADTQIPNVSPRFLTEQQAKEEELFQVRRERGEKKFQRRDAAKVYSKLKNSEAELFKKTEENKAKRGIDVSELNELLQSQLKSWQGVRHQGVNTFYKVNMGGTTMYFSGNCFIFVVESTEKRWISRVYEGRDAAMRAFHSSIIWDITMNK